MNMKGDLRRCLQSRSQSLSLRRLYLLQGGAELQLTCDSQFARSNHRLLAICAEQHVVVVGADEQIWSVSPSLPWTCNHKNNH